MRGCGAAVLMACIAHAAPAGDAFMRRCLADKVLEATDEARVGELRRACERAAADSATETAVPADEDVVVGSPADSAVEKRLTLERAGDRPFSLQAHRPSYLLPYAYNDKVNDNFVDSAGPVTKPKRTEAGFQISFKAPLWRDVLDTGDTLFLGYTNRSFWQLYDRGNSSPFRTTDHEPEVFWRHYGDLDFGPVKFSGFDLGLSHQSNGRSRPLSRSWNRIVGASVVSVENLTLGVRGWLRLQEDDEDDDNPDIEDYMGNAEFRLIYAPNRNTFTLMGRPVREGGAVEFTWSHALSPSVRFYAQYYNGFGETLIDYDHRVKRYSFGIALNDYLLNDDRPSN